MRLGVKDCFGLKKRRSKAAYLREGRFSKLVSSQRVNFQLRNDFHKGIAHRSSFCFMLLVFRDAIYALQK